MSSPILRFKNDKDADFATELKRRVNQYFTENNISKHANFSMVLKTITVIAMLYVPYFLMLMGMITNLWLGYALWIFMGLGVAGIGMCVMHDANHGAYSKHKWVNKLLGRMLDVVGGNATNWKIQHNLLHHTFTNIAGLDGDINTQDVMRFAPDQAQKKHHKYQHFYAWFLYGFMTIQWLAAKDFRQMVEFHKKYIKGNKTMSRGLWQEYTLLVLGKIFYYSYMIVIPMIFFPFAWWQVLIGVFLMQYTTGFILASTFQLAHVMPSTEFLKPEENQSMVSKNWYVHQLETTTDFAHNSKLVTWYVGGLNFQVEHHLFPNICHIHYNKIAAIVEKTANDYNVAYHKLPTLADALSEHWKHLKHMGNEQIAHA